MTLSNGSFVGLYSDEVSYVNSQLFEGWHILTEGRANALYRYVILGRLTTAVYTLSTPKSVARQSSIRPGTASYTWHYNSCRFNHHHHHHHSDTLDKPLHILYTSKRRRYLDTLGRRCVAGGEGRSHAPASATC